MFPLDADSVPATTLAWRDALVATLGHLIGVAPVVQLDGDLPTLERLNIEVSGGNLNGAERPDAAIVGPTATGPVVSRLRVAAHPLCVRDIPFAFDLTASSVSLVTGHNSSGRVVVAMHDAADGQLSLGIGARDLDAALLAVARAGAAAQGVEILALQSRLASSDSHSLDVTVDLTARKIMKFTVRVTGRLSLDDALTATATHLKVEGSGMAAGFAAGILRSQLKKLEGQPLPLMQFSLGNVRLRDVAVGTGDGLSIRAAFGTA